MKHLTKLFLLIFILLCGSLTNCNLKERIKDEGALGSTRKIREAENAYQTKFRRYGSISELVENGLIGTEFSDGVNYDYRFNLTVEENRYSLSVTPNFPPKPSAVEELSFYLDETGIIRVSFKINQPADSKSSPIAHQ